MDIQKVVQVGNSSCVVVSIAYMDRLGLKRGDYVTIELTQKGLLVRPLKLEKEEEKKDG